MKKSLLITFVLVFVLSFAVFAEPSAVESTDTAVETNIEFSVHGISKPVENEEAEETATLTAHSGTCGTNLTWTLDNEGVLTISGTGNMTNWSSSSSIPWNFYRAIIKKAIIQQGVTSIGSSAFYYCTNLKSVEIPDSVTSIGFDAFEDCTSLESVTIPDSVTSIGDYAFYKCSSLETVYYSGSSNDWKNISIGSYNSPLSSAYVIMDTVSYDANGGTGAPSSQSKIYGINLTLSSVVPVREGYNFICWSTNRNSNGETKKTLSVSGLESAHNYAYNTNKSWTISSPGAKSIELTFDSRTQFESNFDYLYVYDKNNTQVGIYSGTELAGKNITVQGYKVTLKLISDSYVNEWGFKVTSAYAFGDETYEPGEIYTIDSDVTLYAIWQLKTYSVTYNANGGPSAPSSQTKEYFDNLVLTSSVPTRIGYTFKGWARTTDGEVEFHPGDIYTTNEAMTLYAVWEGQPYEVRYNANGGTGAPENQTKIHGTNLVLSTVIPERYGYEFIGWSTETASDAEVEYSPGDTYSTNQNVVLYAVWTPWTSGTCGDNLTWELDVYGTLTISGFGEMSNFTMDKNAPWHASSIKKVVVEDGITSIGDYVFFATDLNFGITIPNSVTSIGESAFSDSSMGSITIPDSVVEIKPNAFAWCYNLFDVTIGRGVKSIGKDAFIGCSSLGNVNVNSLADWCDIAFENHNSNPLTGAYVQNINGENIEILIIPEGVTYISDYAFSNCKGLEEVTLPNSVTRIGKCSFYKCDNLIKITMSDGLTEICDSAFYNCDNLKSVEIPQNVMSIGNSAFHDCDRLAEMKMYESVTTIGDDAFFGCNIEEIVFDGTSADWDNIAIKQGNESLLYANVEFLKTFVKYDANGGTEAPSEQKKKNGQSVSLSKDKPVRQGYLFMGWSTESGATKSKYKPGATYKENKDITLYAVWEVIDVKKVTLNKTKCSLAIGFTTTLAAMVSPSDARHQYVTWSSSNESVATVDENGVVTALKAGSVKITATSHNGKKATCTVTIGEPATKVEFTGLKSTSLALGKSITLKAKAACEGKTKPVSTAVVFEIIEGEDIATLDAKGKLTAKGLGEVTVRARAEAGTDDAYADVTINICIPATKVTLNTTKASMIVDGTLKLKATMTPAINTDTLTWSVDKEDIATVDENGVVTALKAGKVKVTAMTGSGKKATCTVTIGEPATRVDVTALKTTSVAVGKYITLKGKAACEGKIKPVSTAVVFDIIEGEDIATIDAKGKLTAKAEGTVVVRISAEAGTEEAYEDVEIRICNLATKVTLNMTKATLTAGDELQLEATMSAKGECTDTLTWSVDKPSIATVDENGLVTAHSAGKVKVTAKSGSGKSASCTITVTK